MSHASGLLRIAGGRVVDPANGVDDEVRDIWIGGGKVVAAPADPAERADRTIDATGLVVMPGGVDVHCHIAGPKVTAARAFRPEEARAGGPHERRPGFRSGALGSVPTTFATGYRYAGLGYTTAVDAAVPALGARHARLELADTPVIDKAFLLLMGNDHYAMRCVSNGDNGRLRDYLSWLLNTTGALGFKAVNPGGVERWKQGRGRDRPATLDDEVEGFNTTPRFLLAALAGAADDLGLPHPLHVHGLNLGLPGNAAITMETMRALDGRRAHLAHVQFHSYGGRPEHPGKLSAVVAELAEFVDAHDGITVDVGQIAFGEATAMTADGAVGYYLARLTGRKWINHDVELETGCGIVPITYEDKSAVHALQWAAGLEWFLRVADPWKVALSTDHPNGGSFLAYPRIIAWLMDPARRAEALAKMPPSVLRRCDLAGLDRAYTLREIAIITRAGPARILGLANKGHLGPGADADLTLYQPDDDHEGMFLFPRYVVKAGVVVVDGGEPRPAAEGLLLGSAPGYDPGIVPALAEWFDDRASIRFANFAAPDAEPRPSAVVPCRGAAP